MERAIYSVRIQDLNSSHTELANFSVDTDPTRYDLMIGVVLCVRRADCVCPRWDEHDAASLLRSLFMQYGNICFFHESALLTQSLGVTELTDEDAVSLEALSAKMASSRVRFHSLLT